jgi:DNA-binding transcriptional MerR regulator
VVSIDDMAKAGCTTPRGIRYWEDEGLLGPVERTPGKQRRYTDEQLQQARIIAACQFGGWNLDDAKRMVLVYDREAYDALVRRLMSQATLAEQLAVALPQPKDEIEGVEWDL